MKYLIANNISPRTLEMPTVGNIICIVFLLILSDILYSSTHCVTESNSNNCHNVVYNCSTNECMMNEQVMTPHVFGEWITQLEAYISNKHHSNPNLTGALRNIDRLKNEIVHLSSNVWIQLNSCTNVLFVFQCSATYGCEGIVYMNYGKDIKCSAFIVDSMWNTTISTNIISNQLYALNSSSRVPQFNVIYDKTLAVDDSMSLLLAYSKNNSLKTLIFVQYLDLLSDEYLKGTLKFCSKPKALHKDLLLNLNIFLKKSYLPYIRQ